MRVLLRAATCGAALALALCFVLPQVEGQPTVNPIDPHKLQKPPGVPVPTPCDGADPVASRPTIVRLVSGGKGILNITGSIVNQGRRDFISSASEAAAAIIVRKVNYTDAGTSTVVRRVTVPRLNAGQSLNLSGTYEIPSFLEWGHREPRPGECKVEVEVEVNISHSTIGDDCNCRNDRCPSVPANFVKYMVSCPR
jgi:hypothetical protein